MGSYGATSFAWNTSQRLLVLILPLNPPLRSYSAHFCARIPLIPIYRRTRAAQTFSTICGLWCFPAITGSCLFLYKVQKCERSFCSFRLSTQDYRLDRGLFFRPHSAVLFLYAKIMAVSITHLVLTVYFHAFFKYFSLFY